MYTPEYLTIGHVTKDNVPEGAILGGTCSYSALTAHRLGLKSAIVTSAGPDIPSLDPLHGVLLEVKPASHSTTFENVYRDGERHQKWLTTALDLSLHDVPNHWRDAPIVHLGALSQEISPQLFRQFPNSLTCVTIQGWLRGQDEQFNVIYRAHPELNHYLADIDILVISLADLFGNQSLLDFFVANIGLVVETLGSEGCRIYQHGQVVHVPTYPETEVDPTGAGDIFAAAFFIRYKQTKDPLIAAQFANATASLSVGSVGMTSIPTLAQVEARFAGRDQ
ncbi:PfkB family carbohydrate kinase [Anaerolineales bacterium HSG25]|nr:PfkB family carbohydrate kinase [Anaerolineales bacterium HSG25]